MTPRLTDEQRAALLAHPGGFVRVTDEATHTDYILMPIDAFARIKAMVFDDGAPDVDEFLPLAHESFGELWDAPGMERYDDYANEKSKQ